MPATEPRHHCRVLAAPVAGVWATHTVSARHYPRHLHACWGFGFLADGAQHSASGIGPVDAYAGDILTTNPGEVHDGRPIGGPSRRWITVYLEPQAMASLADMDVERLEITRPAFQDPVMLRHVSALARCLEAGAEPLASEQALVACCGWLVEHHTTRTPRTDDGTPAAVAAARDWLADAMLAPPTLTSLAQRAGTSKYQLLRAFQRAYGLTPYAWLLQQRAEHARALIARGEALGEAALAAGFADQSHMTRVFTRQFGFTPGTWRQAHLQ
jgi:AraC-like DNA-binding protein